MRKSGFRPFGDNLLGRHTTSRGGASLDVAFACFGGISAKNGVRNWGIQVGQSRLTSGSDLLNDRTGDFSRGNWEIRKSGFRQEFVGRGVRLCRAAFFEVAAAWSLGGFDQQRGSYFGVRRGQLSPRLERDLLNKRPIFRKLGVGRSREGGLHSRFALRARRKNTDWGKLMR